MPYFDNKTIIVAASLTGGNTFSIVANIFKEFLQCLPNVDCPDDDVIYSALIVKAKNKMDTTTLQVDPVFYGERHEPTKRGSVSNIAADNFTVGDIVSSVLKGVVQNLQSMMPDHILETLQVSKIYNLACIIILNVHALSNYDYS